MSQKIQITVYDEAGKEVQGFITKEELTSLFLRYCLLKKGSTKILNTRIKQYHINGLDQPWTYVGERCSCGANCHHKEYDMTSKNIYCVCNGCNEDLYLVKDEFIEEMLEEGIWK